MMIAQAADWSPAGNNTTHPTPRSLVSGWCLLLLQPSKSLLRKRAVFRIKPVQRAKSARPPSGVTIMRARIYQPARNAMQSGQAKTHTWVLEFAPTAARVVEPLMGWTGSEDVTSQVRMQFESQKAAEKYASDHGIEVSVAQPHKRKPVIRQGGYGENFATNRRSSWTH
jgi:ETC complex I subunit-like protein